jgi:hypothetical protein
MNAAKEPVHVWEHCVNIIAVFILCYIRCSEEKKEKYTACGTTEQVIAHQSPQIGHCRSRVKFMNGTAAIHADHPSPKPTD